MSCLIVLLLAVTPVALKVQKEEKKEIHSFVDSSCKIIVNTTAGKLFLKSKTGNFVVVNGQVETEDGKVIGPTTPKALLCESNTGPIGKSEAFFTVTDSAPYFNRWQKQFFNKHCWAKQNKVKYYLWFGKSTQAEYLDLFKERPADAVKCGESPGQLESSPSHYYFPIGMRKIMEDFDVSWVASMDLGDSWFNGKHWTKNMFKHYLTNNQSDLVFAAQLGKSGAFVNSALWAAKNTEWSKAYLDEVFKNRCGSMVQHSYWNTFLTNWKKEKPEFTWNADVMSKYASAKKQMINIAKGMLSPEQVKVYEQYRSDTSLREALHFGKHMTILPNAAPIGDAPESFIGYRGNTDHSQEPFQCHAPPHAFNNVANNCAGVKYMCTGGATCQCD